jgi:Domain of unknown function (DUF4159)
MRNPSRSLFFKWLPVVFVTVAIVAGSSSAATPAQVADSIDRAKAFLYSRQLHGNWEAVSTRHGGVKYPNDPSGLQFGGMTAITTFALLACGDNPQSNDNLKQAVEWLEKADMRGIYAISLRAQVWGLLPEDPTVKKCRLHDLAMLLDDVRQGRGEEAGFFGYGEGVDKRQYDHSVSQFGVLGLWSLVQDGEEVETRYWREFDKAWRSQQRPSGAWCYWAEPPPAELEEKEPEGFGGELLSMTAAGVATLYITQDYANTSGAKTEGNIKDANIAAGMQWIGSHLDSINSNPWSIEWRYYTMFGICRIGLASGYKRIGSNDWFQWGADTLLKEQDPANGSWGSQLIKVSDDTPPVDMGVFNTAFSALFLSRGRAPILFNKLQYNILKTTKKVEEANWNQRPRDIANLTRFLGKQSETQLNWQIVSLDQPSDLTDAPMLYMAGNQVLNMTAGDVEKLRDYVNAGGIIIGHADASSTAFDVSFRKLGQAMFPGETFHELPADHPIYRNEDFNNKSWMPVPHVEAIDNGARIQMLLLPIGDPAREWQTQTFPKITKYSFGQLMMNIYLYAVDKQGLRTKGDTFIVKRRDGVQTENTTPVKIARLQYDGNWNPEPGGWLRLANILHNHKRLDIDVVPVELGKGLLTSDFKLAHLTGTAMFTLTAPQRLEIKKYVDGGGTLLMDAAGGKSAFALSAQEELGKIFPGTGTPPVLPIKDPVYSAGDPLTEITYRQFARQALGNLHSPQLRGFADGKRTNVFLSKEDLSVGLVGQPVDGIIGYDPASATQIVEDIVLYAVH